MKKNLVTFLQTRKKQVILTIITGIFAVGFLFDLSSFIHGKQYLQSIYAAAEGYLKQFGVTPESLREIEMFAQKSGEMFKVKNGSSHISYERLNQKFFVVQEYWHKAQTPFLTFTNLVLAKDFFVLPPKKNIHFYPFEMLDGIETTDLNIGVVMDYIRGEKKLVLTSKQQSLTQVAPHGYVDEFFVLPGEEKIIFAASGKHHLPGGLFLWDWKENRIQNLTEISSLQVVRGKQNFQVTLAGMTSEIVYFFAKNDNSYIFNCSNFQIYQIKTGKIGKDPVHCQTTAFYKTNPFFARSDIQKHFSEDRLDKFLEWWQDKLARVGHNDTSTPHALWILANLYAQLSENKTLPADQKKTLEIFARELLGQVSRMPTAPNYLQELSLRSLQAAKMSAVLRFRFTTAEVLGQ